MKNKGIPYPVIKRLPLYYRLLLERREEGFIRSSDIASLTNFSSSQIRRDLSYFGRFGRRGKGYSVRELEKSIKDILGINKLWNVCIIGAGNLGTALLNYKGFYKQGFRIVCAFDVKRQKCTGSSKKTKIYHIDKLPFLAKKKNINIAILAVPAEAAIEVAKKVVSAGIKGILNFAPVNLRLPKNIKVLNIDMSSELIRLAYLLAKE